MGDPKISRMGPGRFTGGVAPFQCVFAVSLDVGEFRRVAGRPGAPPRADGVVPPCPGPRLLVVRSGLAPQAFSSGDDLLMFGSSTTRQKIGWSLGHLIPLLGG